MSLTYFRRQAACLQTRHPWPTLCRLVSIAQNELNEATVRTDVASTHPATPEDLVVQRVRRAVVVVDLVESVRLMLADEGETIERWRRFVQQVRSEILPRHGSRLVKSLGDGLMLECPEMRPALACAASMQQCMRRLNESPSTIGPMALRIGVHVADVVVDELDIYGAAVNLTARLASLAQPDEIITSADGADEIVAGIDAELEDLGECYFKHIDRPVRSYRVRILSHGGTAGSADPRTARISTPADGDRVRVRLAVLTPDGAAEALTLRSLIADEMGALLSAHATVDVVSRMSTRHVQGTDPTELMRRLGVDYAVCGSCTCADTHATIVLELVHAVDQRVVWSQALARPLTALIEEPAGCLRGPSHDVMAAVEADETGRARSLPLACLSSYALLVGGVRLMHRLSRTDFERSHDAFEALVARHPRHPDGYAWLAKWHILQVHQGWSVDAGRSVGMARDLSRRALEQHDQCELALVIAGMVKTFSERQLDQAEQIYASVLACNPNDALAWLLKSMVHAFRGEGVLAVDHAQRAMSLSPLDPMLYYYEALAASAEASAGRFDAAIELAKRSLARNALHASTLRILAISYAMVDRVEDARAIVRRMLDLEPEFTVDRFLRRSPSADYPIGRTFAAALARAGVPA